jgi:hypothetical protein
MNRIWDSPYQTASYHAGLLAAGIDAELLETASGPVYFDGSGDVPTAWELSSTVSLSTDQLRGRAAFRLCSIPSLETPDAHSYYTRVVSAADSRFASRFMRNVRKARQALPQARLEIAETEEQIQKVLAAFDAHPDRRDAMSTAEFSHRILSLLESGSLTAYALVEGSNVLGSACVLRSPTQANLRYYTAERRGNAGHLLHYEVISQLFEHEAVDIVDLSGISPTTKDSKLKGIDEFKQQIGGTIVEFEQL